MPLSLFEIFKSNIALPTEVIQSFGMFLFMGDQVAFVYGFKTTVFVGAFPYLSVMGFDVCC